MTEYWGSEIVNELCGWICDVYCTVRITRHCIGVSDAIWEWNIPQIFMEKPECPLSCGLQHSPLSKYWIKIVYRSGKKSCHEAILVFLRHLAGACDISGRIKGGTSLSERLATRSAERELIMRENWAKICKDEHVLSFFLWNYKKYYRRSISFVMSNHDALFTLYCSVSITFTALHC